MTEQSDRPLRVTMAHGAGGEAARRLVREHFVRVFADDELNRLDDSAIGPPPRGQLAFTTDSYVVKPLFFAGGDIGRLAVSGTVNDLAAAGARALYLSMSFIIEEGLETSVLDQVVASAARTAQEAEVRVVCGDTKVVEKGSADQLFITTSGVGEVVEGARRGADRIRVGDAVILSGQIGEHAIAVMSAREGLLFQTTVRSDVAPLGKMVLKALDAGEVHAMRDPTRGGVAGVLNEFATEARLGIELMESSIPVSVEVSRACDMLGLDVLQAANEGKMLFFVADSSASRVVDALREQPLGKAAAVIGRVTDEHRGKVWMQTELGGRRVVDSPVAEATPRIC